eukprot:NODE_1162_length_979_cov_86.583333_g1117_i0.p1 GENE.NODE_1162_length_979_cov_86.583333_g1117_i0~~NODE_1162_length_979_cov_86.583333_g1117_i0.p1  ORF type:complete len:284 (+),score=38.24 NODE_1162_length_979_cov_86.583333_g1117_i0:70-921(+)
MHRSLLLLHLPRLRLHPAATTATTTFLHRLRITPLTSPRYFAYAKQNRSTTGVVVPKKDADKIALNTLQPAPGSKHRIKRVGRGDSSGRGKTSTRGQKGQKARTGSGPYIGFEGGQTPLYLRLGKKGHSKRNKKLYKLEPLNLYRLQSFIQQGKLDPTKRITMHELYKSNCVNDIRNGVKLLAEGSEAFNVKVDIEVSKASSKAIEAIERCGGTVKAVYYNPLGLRVLLKPEKFEPHRIPRFALPTKAKDIAFYTSEEKRGYLAPKYHPEIAKKAELPKKQLQ